MTLPADLPKAAPSRFGWRDLGLWSGAAALVLGAHVVVAYAVQDFSMANEADGGPPPAQAIDVMPMLAMPAVEEQVAALDALTPDQSEPTPATEIAPEEPGDKTIPVVDRLDVAAPEETEPSRAETSEEADQPDAIAPDETDAAQTDVVPEGNQPPLDESVPDIVQAIAPEVVVPMPRPKPVEIAKEPKRPVVDKARETAADKAKKPVDKPKPRPRKEKTSPSSTATVAGADGPPAARTAAPKSTLSASRSGASAKWESRLASWIRQRTRYPSSARARGISGKAYVAFTVEASGRVVSAKIVRSAGDPDLDRAALSVLQGATVPAPPPELGGLQSRTAPFVFDLRN